MLGLSDETIAHTKVEDLGEGIAGHEKYNTDYVLDEVRPEIIVIADGDSVALTTEVVRQASLGPSPVKAREELLNDQRLWERYVVSPLFIEERWFNVLVRADVAGDFQPPAAPDQVRGTVLSLPVEVH
jgi:hypothetical protein